MKAEILSYLSRIRMILLESLWEQWQHNWWRERQLQSRSKTIRRPQPSLWTYSVPPTDMNQKQPMKMQLTITQKQKYEQHQIDLICTMPRVLLMKWQRVVGGWMRMELVVLLMCFFGCKKEVNDHQSNQLGVSDEGGDISYVHFLANHDEFGIRYQLLPH